ncbi:MAG: hypothetical protein WBC78_26530 [Candidatus Sulfotelmatobacter sp.]
MWVRWFLPSISDLFFVALVGVLVFTNLSVRLLGDAGIGWHIRTGQIILATHAIPHVDPFSSSMSGHPWFAWEWLYDVLVGWLESATGLNGVVLLTALIIAMVFSWTFRLLLHRGTNIAAALVLVLLAASASMIHFLARPHVVSWLLTVAWFWILESSENDRTDSNANFSATSAKKRARLWLLPLIMLLWVNVHGGFLLGFALLAIYWVSAAGQWLRLTLTLTEDRFENFLRDLRAGRRLRDLTFVGIVTAAATLLNPYGSKLHIHIYRYLTNRFLMDHIDEFQSPNFHYVAQKCFAALLLLTLLALAAKRRGISVSHGLVLLFAVYSGLYASRNIPVSSLLAILVIGPWLSDAMARLAASLRTPSRWRGLAYTQFLHRMEGIELGLRGHLWPIAAIVLTCWTVAHGGKLGAVPLMHAHFDSKRFPVAAVDYLKKDYLKKDYLEKGQGPLLSPDSWGGYLIYEFYPEFYPRVKVVIDDRHDFYGEEFLKSYLKMIHAEPGWEEFLQQHAPSCVIVPKDSALANLLLETTSWKPIHSDDVAVAFVPTDAERE